MSRHVCSPEDHEDNQMGMRRNYFDENYCRGSEGDQTTSREKEKAHATSFVAWNSQDHFFRRGWVHDATASAISCRHLHESVK